MLVIPEYQSSIYTWDLTNQNKLLIIWIHLFWQYYYDRNCCIFIITKYDFFSVFCSQDLKVVFRKYAFLSQHERIYRSYRSATEHMRIRLAAKCHNWQRPDKGRMRRWVADVIHLCTIFLSYAFHSLKIFFTVNSEILWIPNLLAYSYKLEFRHSVPAITNIFTYICTHM